MNNESKLSFIVPIFNMESYLRECIESILAQQLENYEIILIDDGSTDSSPLICKEYVEKYSNIRYFRKTNGGISSARNYGLKQASGEYVCFIDSDDFYMDDFAKSFLDLCESNHLDIIRGWYGLYDEETKSYLPHAMSSVPYCGEVLSGSAFLEKSIKYHVNEVVPWLGFFRREYLISNSLAFPEGIAYEEDQLFFLDALICQPGCRIMQLNNEFYAYRKRQGSATKTPSVKQAQDVLYIADQETKLLSRYQHLTENTKRAAKRYICSSFYQLTSIYGRVSKADRKLIADSVPQWMKRQCIRFPYDRHQFIKIVLFAYVRGIVDLVYDRRNSKQIQQ